MKTKQIVLVNVNKFEKSNRDRLHIPTKTQLNAIKPGYFVKVIFVGCKDCIEQFWIQVLKVNKSGDITGLIANRIETSNKYHLGDNIKIKQHHVSKILKQKGKVVKYGVKPKTSKRKKPARKKPKRKTSKPKKRKPKSTLSKIGAWFGY